MARIAALSGEAQPGARRTKIESNVVVLRSADPVEKIAVSFAFAQSVKLSALETALEQTIEEVRALPEQLARHGRGRAEIQPRSSRDPAEIQPRVPEQLGVARVAAALSPPRDD